MNEPIEIEITEPERDDLIGLIPCRELLAAYNESMASGTPYWMDTTFHGPGYSIKLTFAEIVKELRKRGHEV